MIIVKEVYHDVSDLRFEDMPDFESRAWPNCPAAETNDGSRVFSMPFSTP